MSIDMDLVNSALVTQRSASDAAAAQAANAANAKKTTLDQAGTSSWQRSFNRWSSKLLMFSAASIFAALVIGAVAAH